MKPEEILAILRREGVSEFRLVEAEQLAKQIAEASSPQFGEDNLGDLVRLFLRPDDTKTMGEKIKLLRSRVDADGWPASEEILQAAGYDAWELHFPEDVAKARKTLPPGEYWNNTSPPGLETQPPVKEVYRVSADTHLPRREMPRMDGVIPDPTPSSTAPISLEFEPETQIQWVRPEPAGPESAGARDFSVNRAICSVGEAADPILIFGFYAPFAPGGLVGISLSINGQLANPFPVPPDIYNISCVIACRCSADYYRREELHPLLERLNDAGVPFDRVTIYESTARRLNMGVRSDGLWGEVLEDDIPEALRTW